ncbi:N-acetyltransferase [Lysobacter psychrotolerans]|uniref:N-acetyltransferase n=2 Tax=Montanilutibacter psychrotolerans TaxID=1327343 RepID=A0A3M8T3J8_9GAMM|nr:N-acetyltransferase [Lysobacter psychrotolerans]
MTMENPTISHDPDTSAFLTQVDGVQARLDYCRIGDTIAITHTGVPREIGGRGIAAALVKAAFDYARQAGLKVRPDCSYAAAWLARHPQYADLAASPQGA